MEDTTKNGMQVCMPLTLATQDQEFRLHSYKFRHMSTKQNCLFL